MSLLIEALKQAEARKGPKQGKPTEGQDKSEAGPPTAEAASSAPAESSAPASRPAGAGLELSLAPQEEAAPPREAVSAPEPPQAVDAGPSPPAAEARVPAAPSPEPAPRAASTQAPAPEARPAEKPAADAPSAAPSAQAAPPAAAAPAASADAPRPGAGARADSPATSATKPASGPAPAAPSGRLQTGSEASRRAAREVLAAAQQRTHPGRTRQRVLLGALVMIALLMSAGGWWLSRTPSGLGSMPSAVTPVSDAVLAEAQTAAGSTGDVDAEPAFDAPATPLAVPSAAPGVDAAAAGTQAGGPAAKAGPATPAAAAGTGTGLATAATPEATTAATRSAPATDVRPAATLVIERARQAQQPLLEGYAALNRGELDTARRAYQLALQGHPRHPDALLGLAVIAEREGDLSTAARRYREVLKVDPRNPTALSALLGSGQGDAGVRSESQLREALAAQPRSAALHFALGNVLAANQRWDEAQQSYFDAAVLAPDDPDVLFNLGVSLDRLHKPRLALDHYLRAEELRRSRPAAYDPRALARRITTLSQQLSAAEGTPR